MSEVSEEALRAHREQVQAMDAEIAEHVQAIAGGEDRQAALDELVEKRNEIHVTASKMDRALNPAEPPAE